MYRSGRVGHKGLGVRVGVGARQKSGFALTRGISTSCETLTHRVPVKEKTKFAGIASPPESRFQKVSGYDMTR